MHMHSMCIYICIYIYIYIIPVCLNGGFLKVGITQIPQPLWSSVQEIAARVEAAVQDDSQAGAFHVCDQIFMSLDIEAPWFGSMFKIILKHI